MERKHQGRMLRQEIRTTASPQRVWEAWADPARLSQWFADRARGEPRAGGTLTWCFDDFGHEFPYEVGMGEGRVVGLRITSWVRGEEWKAYGSGALHARARTARTSSSEPARRASPS